MRLYRIGDKVVSEDKLRDAIASILEDREAGATQDDVAKSHGVQRSFVSFLETLGEVRKGNRVAMVGFPIANAAEVKALAENHALDFVLVLSQEERENIESGEVTAVFNTLLETIATLRDYDTLVLLASDWRIKTMERILGTEVVGVPLGSSPLREAVTVDVEELDAILTGVMSARPAHGSTSRGSAALKDASGLPGRWQPSRKS
ncbi:MAG: transcriptional regulator [Coriobacteriia bacterium]|nr:transcriptional regulator [Coriobacteriia bacterium]